MACMNMHQRGLEGQLEYCWGAAADRRLEDSPQLHTLLLCCTPCAAQVSFAFEEPRKHAAKLKNNTFKVALVASDCVLLGEQLSFVGSEGMLHMPCTRNHPRARVC